MKYFDTHCHLNHISFQADLDEVIKRALDAGIEFILVPGWDVDSSIAAIELSERFPHHVFAAVGIHPSEWHKVSSQSLHEIQKLAAHPNVVALGEIGLDYFHDPEHSAEQKELLGEMLSIAEDVNKKVLLHSRASMAEIKVLIVAWMYKIQKINHPLKDNPGIFHAFEGTLSEAEELLEFGFKFGVGGPLTYKNSLQKLSVFSSLPVDAICLETDAPYLSPSKHRGERNEPAFLPLITAKLAEIQGKTEVEICNRIFENSYKMFIKEIIT